MTDGSEAYWAGGLRYVIYRGNTMLLQEAIKLAGNVIEPDTAWKRIVRSHWPVESALETPVRYQKTNTNLIGDPNTPPRIGGNTPRPWVRGARLKLYSGEIIDCWVITDANGFHTFGPIGQP